MSRCNANKNEFARLLRNYVQARDELLTFTTAFGCNTPAGSMPGEAVHIYAKPGASREFVHSMLDDGHIDYVVGMWSLFDKKVFSTLKEASSYLTEHAKGDCIYEVGKIGGIDVYSMYTKEEVLEILKEAWQSRRPEDFCSYGERKNGGNNDDN